MKTNNSLGESAIFAIERPAPNLFTYYLLSSLVLGPLFFVLLIPLYFRYHTLRYRFDEEGISMRWGGAVFLAWCCGAVHLIAGIIVSDCAAGAYR